MSRCPSYAVPTIAEIDAEVASVPVKVMSGAGGSMEWWYATEPSVFKCWADSFEAGNFGCGLPVKQASNNGLCDRHRREIVGEVTRKGGCDGRDTASVEVQETGTVGAWSQ